MARKRYTKENVLDAARRRISQIFDSVEVVTVSFSGGKDSSVTLHLVMDEAIKRGRKVGVLIVDLEAQYKATVDHIHDMVNLYRDHIDLHWFCGPINLRNAVTNYQPQWQAWEPGREDIWVRNKPNFAISEYPWFQPGMEFEEFISLWGIWYAGGKKSAAFIGIRAQESFNRYCTIAVWDKRDLMLNGWRWTTKVGAQVYNAYPIYDWLSEDIWRYYSKHPDKPHNRIYDLMQQAGVPLSQQRLCQPYGDDQRKGLWLYQILEPETWGKLIVRVNGANSMAIYVQESGNIMGYNKITKPPGHTWQSFTNLLLRSLPKSTREHYMAGMKKFMLGWRNRGYEVIPDEAPPELEADHWAPSWRRMCKCLLRNDWWMKGLGFQQPKSAAWARYKEMKKQKPQMQDVLA